MNAPAARRWSNFSLRTLLIVVTILCCYLAYQMRFVHERRALLMELKAGSDFQVVTAVQAQPLIKVNPGMKLAQIPLARRFLGDEPIHSFTYHPSDAVGKKVEVLRRAFPEAEFQEVHYEPCHPGCFPHGTLVETVNGPRKIEQILVDDMVLAILPAGEKMFLPVLSIFKTPNRLWEVETSAGLLVTTETQPLCVGLQESVLAGKLVPGSELLRWETGEVKAVRVIAVRPTDRVQPVINLVLGNREPFVASGYLARSKPPREIMPAE